MRYVDPTGHYGEDPVASLPPEAQEAARQEQTEALARAAGSVVGTAKWAVKTGWGLLKLGLGIGSEELGESIVAAGRDPKAAVQGAAERYETHVHEQLDIAQERIAKGDHFGAGLGFTEEVTAPTAATALTVGESVGAASGVALKRAGPALGRLRATLTEAAETQQRHATLAQAQAIIAGRRSELGTIGPIMTDAEAKAVVEAAGTASKRGGAGPVRAGQAGEAVGTNVTGLAKNSRRIPSASGKREYRIPDHMDDAGRFIGEDKAVAKQHLSSQLLDDKAHVLRDGGAGRVEVLIDESTVVTRPLLREHLNPGSPIKLRTEKLK